MEKSQLGEFALIDWIRQRQGSQTNPWTRLAIGDDCAILRVDHGSELLVTTDMLMDGRHFRLAEDGARAVGYKALAVNLSDIAAMAGVPRAAVVAVALPRADAVAVAHGLHAGMRELAERFGVDIVGGDTNAWDGPLVISITMLGEPTARGAVRRAGARPGDAILVTGPLGGSLFVGRHLRPEPRIAEALAVHQVVPIHALIDISDGLSSDLDHILAESGGLGAVLEAASIPIHPDALEMSRHDQTPALDHALNDGEDFELCMIVAAEDADRLLSAPPAPAQLYRVGIVTDVVGLMLQSHDGQERPIGPMGFDHFRTVKDPPCT
jgi:thiamine-monophosphate kinase